MLRTQSFGHDLETGKGGIGISWERGNSHHAPKLEPGAPLDLAGESRDV